MGRLIGVLSVCVGAALAAALCVFLLQGMQEKSTPAKTTQVNVAPEVVPDETEDVDAKAMSPEEREVLIEQTRVQIDALMEDYENHLKNREKRQELKQQIDILVNKYNKLILPVALTDVTIRARGRR
ncbi:hypothetical protein [Alteromonas halophila]|uniref:Uncharacterized protein n=1 Tax=Alteromonas halophila TaxID=516698 RepID=A0A918N1E5_9ALTE|nr:hypothetical protein [Alteromonas halophila]GGW93397.1 hypothetical protein GCM10007391_29690 [Alteromonas halophila]